MSTAAADTKAPLAARLRDARDAANLTQVELARHLEVSYKSIQGWEAGRKPRAGHRRRVIAWVRFVEGLDDGTEFAREMATL